MTNEEIMGRIVSALNPVQHGSDVKEDLTVLRVEVRYGYPASDYGKPKSRQPAVMHHVYLHHPSGVGIGHGSALDEALRHLLKRLASEPLTMAQHDALQALRVEVGL